MVTGSATFTADISLPGMLHARMLLSPHAHAKILTIDVEQGQAVARGQGDPHRRRPALPRRALYGGQADPRRRQGALLRRAGGGRGGDQRGGGRGGDRPHQGGLRSAAAGARRARGHEARLAPGARVPAHLRMRQGRVLPDRAHQCRQSLQAPQGRRRGGLQAERQGNREHLLRAAGPARAAGDPRDARPLEAQRRHRDLDLGPVALRGAEPPERRHRHSARAHQGGRAARGRRLRRQGGHTSGAAGGDALQGTPATGRSSWSPPAPRSSSPCPAGRAFTRGSRPG